MSKKIILPLAGVIVLLAVVLLIPPLPITCHGTGARAQGDCEAAEATAAIAATRIDELLHLSALSSDFIPGDPDAVSDDLYPRYFLPATQFATYNNVPQCDNGIEPRLWKFANVIVTERSEASSTLRQDPGGRPVAGDSELPPGTFMRVLDGPACTPGGNYAWYIRVPDFNDNQREGWVTEGNSVEYFLDPLDHEGNILSDPDAADFGFTPGQACPFVFTHDGTNWVYETTIISDHVGPESEAESSELLNNFNGRLLIRELEPETSYLDLVVIDVEHSNGDVTRLLPDNESLATADDVYEITNMGDEVELFFAGFDDLDDVQSVAVVAEGYYVMYPNAEEIMYGER
jgi:hypothetical protein